MEKQRVGKLEEKRKDASAVNQEEKKKRESYSGHAESDIHCHRSNCLFKTANSCSLSADRIDFFSKSNHCCVARSVSKP